MQIIPSAKGIKGQIESAIGGDVDNAGKSAGKSLGGKLVGAFSTVMATAAIGQTISKAFSEGAALQQSVGGIETLFKDHADTVKKYANEAYKTAGLSANDYMESVTSFSASLLQGLGGDTAKAAEVANMAMIDMSDNANKMGTDMELIQNAYQGFAKNNYTMLDNLKLGYGGTQSEMQRLLADAEKISGVKYDISNLSDVYSAIHVIQGELGITGTTAKEAASTFAGSMAAMKASFSNVLAGLTLGQDITPALQSLTSSIMTFVIDNLLPMLWNIVKGIPTIAQEIIKGVANIDWIGTATEMIAGLKDSIGTASAEYLTSDNAVIPTLLNSITAKLPEVLKKGVEIVTNVVNGILQNIPKVIETVGTLMTTFINFFYSNLPNIWKSGVDLVLNLVKGIIDNLPTIISSVATVVSNMLATFAKHLPQLLQQGITMLGQLAAGLIQAIPTLIGKIPTIFSNIVDAFKKHDWLSIGADILRGIAEGISNAVGVIVEAAKSAAKAAFDAAKEFLGIESPSKLFRYGIGQYIPEGMALGIEDNVSMVSKAMNDLTKEATGTINADVSMGISQSRFGNLAGMDGRNANSGFQQNVNIYAPKELSPSEVARQTRNATRNMVLSLQGA